MKKCIAAAMAVLLMLTMITACNSEKAGEEMATNNDIAQQIVLIDSALSEYKIVRSDLGDETEVSASLLMRKGLKTVFDTELTLTTDWKDNGISDKEILIGNTERKESQDAIAELNSRDFIVRVTGSKLVIVGASPRYTVKAVEYFLSEYTGYTGEEDVTKKTTLSLPSDLSYYHQYELISATAGNNDYYFPKGQTPTLIYSMNQPSGDTGLVAVSLQGLLARISNEQIMFKGTSYNNFLELAKNDYIIEVIETDDTWKLVTEYADILSGYILCTPGTAEVNVANSLCAQLNAIIVTPSTESKAKELGLECVLDVTGKDDAWLRSSDYFDNLSRKIAVNCLPENVFKLRDYAIVAGAYVYDMHYETIKKHTEILDFLDDNFTVFGWNDGLGEYDMIKSVSMINGSLVPADHAINLSTLSSFPSLGLKQKTEDISATETSEPHHTVCFILSDGDNMQWTVNDYTTSDKWYGNALRTSDNNFYMGWGLPAATLDVASPTFNYFYENMTEKDEFVLQLSGLGYTYPSMWKSTDALRSMAKELNDIMSRADMNILEILDDHAFTQKRVDEYLSILMEQPDIDAALYIDFAKYAGYNGEIIWSNNKPIISAKYQLWSGFENVNSLVRKINEGSRDAKSKDAYTFVTVHAWSGMNEEGKIVEGGNTLNGIKAIMDQLDDDVDIVTPSEFVRRIIANEVGK